MHKHKPHMQKHKPHKQDISFFHFPSPHSFPTDLNLDDLLACDCKFEIFFFLHDSFVSDPKISFYDYVFFKFFSYLLPSL